MSKHKRYARFIIDTEFSKWREHPVMCASSPDGVNFSPIGALRAFRLREKTKSHSPKWVAESRIWQIKARLNYGRY